MALTTSLEGNGLDTLIHHHERREEARDASLASAHLVLHRELTEALLRNPMAICETPGWGPQQPRASAVDIVADEFAGSDGDKLLDTLLRICARAAHQGDAMAQSWIEVVAQRHASFHAEDHAQNLAGRD